MTTEPLLADMESLARSVLPRGAGSRFQEDLQTQRETIQQLLEGSRVLLVGGAGTLGSATLRALLPFRPAQVDVVDLDENGLAELVRDLRSRTGVLDGIGLRALPLAMGGGGAQRLIRESEPYHHVLNFAALKHVRSEKDPYSLLQLLETNVLALARLLGWLGERGGVQRTFSVSTDKAADPASLMGASKRIMEHVLFQAPGVTQVATSARFANVAFSNGSLLHGFVNRLAKGQPLAAPRDTRRYFLTPEEGGRLCLLGAFGLSTQRVAIPRMEPGREELSLEEVARRFLHRFGLEAVPHVTEEEAKAAVSDELSRGRYPLLLTPRDTSGEKPAEIFVGSGETVEDTGMKAIAAVVHRPISRESLAGFVAQVEGWLARPEPPLSKEAMVEAIHSVVPELQHVETGVSLDGRM
ncbi:MAG: polysaccharide biosynthesis protein [Gemmatimonadota bacterium]